MARPEQTEKATPKRRSEARQRGQVAKSQDLVGAGIFLVGVIVLHASLSTAVGGVGQTMQGVLSHVYMHQDLTIHSVWALFIQAIAGIWFLLAFLFFMGTVFAVAGNVLQFGFLFAPKLLAPNFGKINPLTGLQRMFSKSVLVNLLKQIAKLVAVFIIVYTSVVSNIPMFYTLAHTSAPMILSFINDLVFSIGWKFGLLLLIIGLADYFYQRYELEQSLKMTKTEVKDEYKQAEGSPEAKAAFKKRQRELSRRRMMAAIPKATVVVTNPTHFAVALEWDEVKMDAPVVTAKGADLLAKRIRELAKEHNIPIMENPPLARTLYAQVELDQAIPPNLYAAVAQVIAFVFKLKRRSIA